MCGACGVWQRFYKILVTFNPSLFNKEIRCPGCGELIALNIELVEVDGETLVYDRIESDCKPMNMKIDLDNVDISREWEMLMTNFHVERPAGYGDEYLKKKWEEFNREEETKTKPLTPEEFHQEMRNIRDKWYDNYDDEEVCHIKMDDLMCELLQSLGYGDGIDAFKNTPKWYA